MEQHMKGVGEEVINEETNRDIERVRETQNRRM